MLKDKTFLLGVGAQKCGTTWLADYLSSRSEVFIHPLKEVHFFDSIYRKDLCGGVEKKIANRLKSRVNKMEGEEIINDVYLNALMYRVAASKDHSLYKEYFKNHVSSHHDLFGEITPSYSLLGIDAFIKIKSMFPKRKIIFLMRDPIERHVSAYKMECKALGVDVDFMSKHFFDTLAEKKHLERTNYPSLIKKLLQVFDSKEVFFGFYETLFSDSEIRRLCKFLSIGFVSGEYGKQLNSSLATHPIQDEAFQAARSVYNEVYQGCLRIFGKDIPSSWNL
ncbi:sulfotransferase domain-containing protein [Vreelandella titanicae]|uniref:sulfotransferase domain-containing protein n=1 Tax=Vreelandella titanicae TaxID=664683 RepID=UPI00315ADF68